MLDQEVDIIQDVNIFAIEEQFERLFKGSLGIFKKKVIESKAEIEIDTNLCLPNPDTNTNYLETDNVSLAVLALNNCKCLTELWIDIKGNCNYQALSVEKLQLVNLTVSYYNSTFEDILQDILKKSKASLRYLYCGGSVNLAPLMNSKELRELKLEGDISDENLQLIRTFYNLEALKIYDNRVTNISDISQKLKTFEFTGKLDDKNIITLPQSVTTVQLGSSNTLSNLKLFLDQNPFVIDVTINLRQRYEAAILLQKYGHFNFNFLHSSTDSSSFKSVYRYLHPECKQQGISSSEPDHILYELLFQRLTKKFELLMPYFVRSDNCEIILRESPPQFIDSLSTFQEAQYCIEKINRRQISEIKGYYDKVFQKQITQNDDDEYLRIILTAYDEVFQLGGNIDQALVGIKTMSQEQRKIFKRKEYFNRCKNNWQLLKGLYHSVSVTPQLQNQ
ncbi:hypothetical protein FGO68_gene359 [Halteria grandinella]|uniref:Uncharacterized protein n=1 Tax=Halteria grandinella TaxID=5974 RepID=A0A8J8NZ19_HALGN|nr:hypothetical protein FGO68_gene359 [Halteria grandinella]